MNLAPRPPAAARAEVMVDLDAIRHNVRVLREWVAPAALMTVVKADGYGHGMVQVARAAREAGCDWLGVATLDEAIALRESGDTGPLMCWLSVPGESYAEALRRDIDVAAYTLAGLGEISEAAQALGRRARVHLKVDTGLARNGAHPDDWEGLMRAAREAEERGDLTVVGLFSHLAASDEPKHPANASQEASFNAAVETAHDAGLRPEYCHLANSAAAVLRPTSRFDLVRCGIATYGLDPTDGLLDHLGLIPAMTVQGRLAIVKRVGAGEGVSYGHTWLAAYDTTVGLVPAGYGEGIPRAASSRAEVWVSGKRRPVRGRICMDQFVVDLDGEWPTVGTEVVLFGPGQFGEPTADDWARACDTINYEIVTRMGGRLSRRYIPEEVAEP